MLLLRNVVAAIGIDLEGHGIHRELRKEVRSCHVGLHRRNCRQGRPWGHATLASYRRGRFPKRGWLSAPRSVQQSVAKLHRAGELTPVWVPDPAHEAIRDLVRARQAAVRTLRQARHTLSGFLL